MSCPVCSHTLQFVAGTGRVFWCPRCGTITNVGLEESATLGASSIPKLVERCRNLQSSLIEAKEPAGLATLHILGILEAIALPENRPS